MSLLIKSSWIYFLIFFITILFGFYFKYRQGHPLISYQDLIKLKPTNQFIQPNACIFHIIGGIPNSPLPDGNFQLNINCPSNQASRNYLRLGAINPPTLRQALNVLSQINNFNLPQNLKYKISGSPVSSTDVVIKVNDVVEVFYE